MDSNYRISAPLKIYLMMNNADAEQRRLMQEAEYHSYNHKRRRLIKPTDDDTSEE